MRRLVAAIILVTLVFAVAGCGGGSSAGDQATDGSTTPGTKPVVKPVDPSFVTNRSENEDASVPVAFPSFTSTGTPEAIKEKLDAGRAMLILFYDPAQESTNDVRAEIDAVMKTYRGLIDLVTFNTGGDPASDSARDAATYATELGVDSTPYIIVVDEGGFITWRWKGFVDRGYITREVERATK